MTLHLFAPGDRATTITTAAALAIIAVLFAAATPARAAAGRPAPVLAQGAGIGAAPNAQVRVVQRALQQRGYDLGSAAVDGRFGPFTDAAVRQMQADHGLAVDGLVGDQTRKALALSRLVGSRTERQRQTHRALTVFHRRSVSSRHLMARSSAGVTVRSGARLTRTSKSVTDVAVVNSDWLHSFAGGAFGGLAIVLAMPIVGFARRRRRRRAPDAGQDPAQAETATSDPGLAPLFHVSPVGAIGQDGSASPTSQDVAPEPRIESALPAGTLVIGYVTVATEPESNGASAGWAAIEATCERSGWELLEIVRDHEHGHGLERPGVGYALKRIANGDARGLVVGDLRRLSGSLAELGALMAWFDEAGATLIALDPPIDTSTAGGRAVVRTLITLSGWERKGTGGRFGNGPRPDRTSGRSPGRPAVTDRPDLVERIAAMRASDMTLQEIADQLNAEGEPTLRGGVKWRPSSIQAALGYRRPNQIDHLPPLEKRERS
jgi:DNA invertase Pin-like site-specific DNA recombinase